MGLRDSLHLSRGEEVDITYAISLRTKFSVHPTLVPTIRLFQLPRASIITMSHGKATMTPIKSICNISQL